MTALAKKYLTAEVLGKLAQVRAECGFGIEDIVRSGVDNPDSSIGAYAGDEDCYGKFAPLFDPIINDYHGYAADASHHSNFDINSLMNMEDMDPSGEVIISTRIRVARNIKGFPFPPALSTDDRAVIEEKVVAALNNLQGELSGTYYPLVEMREETRIQLTEDHFLFKKGDRFLESAGVNGDWPASRGIFHSDDKQFLVWVNEEDELRIISMQPGGDLKQVFVRLAQAIAAIESEITFAYNDHLGYLTSCPTNLGTAMRASVHVKLPLLGKTQQFQQTCATLGLSVRGIHGEHSESEGGVYDISNKQRLGISEVECIKRLYAGIKDLLAKERQLGTI
ncbi:MAG: arginine kinase [Moraxellaceae bacterium]|nr:MAG: arginine kinase [Moraxellaceae bacterium]